MTPSADPSHPDYEILVGLALDLDHAAAARAEDAEMHMTEEVRKESVDEGSITYLAMQRSIRMLGITSPDDLIARVEDVARLTTLYLEAFLLGLRCPARTPRPAGPRRGPAPRCTSATNAPLSRRAMI